MSDNRIQIYENEQRNSFIVFMYDQINENEIISVDLTRFDRNIFRIRNHPKINKHRFSHLEIFVLSNDRDISSSYYPIITYYDEEYSTQNSFHQQFEHYQFIEYQTEQYKSLSSNRLTISIFLFSFLLEKKPKKKNSKKNTKNI